MYQLINVSGRDAEIFLQGQLTQDVACLQSDQAMPAAWCTPKGLVITTMKLIRSDAGFDLLLPAEIAATFLQRISIYKLRADLKLELRPDWHTVAVQTDNDFQRLEDRHLMPNAVANSCRSNARITAICIATDPVVIQVSAPAGELEELGNQNPLSESAWRSLLIRTGTVQISADNSEKYTPHMLSLDLAGAVSFDKGCYTGQEIVARTEYRGKSRRRLARYECESSSIAAGDELLDGDRAVGTVVNASGNDVLAVTPVDIHAKILELNGVDAGPAALPWQD